MQFALFYEIPVPRRGAPTASTSPTRTCSPRPSRASATGGTPSGPWSTTSSRSSRTARTPRSSTGRSPRCTERIRIGYGVRLMPEPYNHPVRTAESVAVLDLLSDGRVDFGTGRSATRAELEGFGVDPAETRRMWQEAIDHVVGCWTNDEYEFAGELLADAPAPRAAQAAPEPHPPMWGATTSEDGHRQVGALGLGLCSFAVGVSPEEVKRKIDIYREAVRALHRPDRRLRERPGRHLHHGPVRTRPRRRSTRPGSPSSGTRRQAPDRSRR